MKKLKKWTSAMFITALSLSVLVCAAMMFYPSDERVVLKEKEVVSFQDDWQITQSDNARTVILTQELPNLGGYADKVLAFQTNSISFTVRLEGEEIYAYGQEAPFPFHVPFGRVITCVDIPQGAEGKTIEVVFNARMKMDPADLTKSMYIGDKDSLLLMFFKQNAGVCIFGIICALISLIFFAIAFFISRKSAGYPFRGFLFLGLFVLLAGIWMVTDSVFLQFFFSNVTCIFIVSFISFMLMPICLCLFLRETHFHSRKALDIITLLMLVNMILCLFLHFTGLVALTFSILFIHLLLLCLVIILIVMCVKEWVVYRNRDIREIAWGLVVLCLTALAALIQFYFNPIQGYSAVFCYGMLLFILLQGVAAFRRSIALLNENAEANFYKRLAYVDVMTRLHNRSAFENTLEKMKVSASKERYVFILFDINNLKHTNDTYGHQMGDTLITRTADCILEVFKHKGEGYRIGGDEFVVIMKNEQDEDVKTALRRFEELVESKNKGAAVPLDIAWGYALQEESSERPDELIKKADENMYRLKEHRKADKNS